MTKYRLLALIPAILLSACDITTTGNKNDPGSEPIANGTLTFKNGYSKGFTLNTYLPGQIAVTEEGYAVNGDPAWTSAGIPAAAAPVLKPEPLNVDVVLQLYCEAENTNYTLISNAEPATFLFSDKRSYVLDLVSDSETTKPVWSWYLADEPSYEVSALAAEAGTTSITLSWEDPAMGDIEAIDILRAKAPFASTDYVKIASVTPGTGTYTATGLAAGTAYAFAFRVQYPEIGSNGTILAITTESSTGGGSTPVTVTPTVSSFTPVDKSANLEADIAITATFNVDMDPATITAETFTVTDASSKAVEGTVEYLNKTATFTPTNPLGFGATYTATVTTGAQSAAGTAMMYKKQWTFSTKGRFASAVTFAAGYNMNSIVAGDVNGDGYEDLIMVNNYNFNTGLNNKIYVLFGSASGIVDSLTEIPGPAAYSELSDVAVADLDGDGDLDIVVADRGKTIDVFRNDGSGGFQADSPSLTASTAQNISVADLNGDGRLDILASYPSQTSGKGLSIFPQKEDATFESVPTQLTGYGTAAIADVNRDGLNDILTINTTSAVNVYTQGTDHTFGDASAYPVGPFSRWISQFLPADLDGDGNLDLVVTLGGNTPSSKLVAVMGDATGTFTGSTTEFVSKDIPSGLLVTDMDGDGKTDVIVYHDAWHYVGYYRGYGDGTFEREELLSIDSNQNTNLKTLAVLDANGDGKPDIVSHTDYGLNLLLQL